jgi:hypothetical protein
MQMATISGRSFWCRRDVRAGRAEVVRKCSTHALGRIHIRHRRTCRRSRGQSLRCQSRQAVHDRQTRARKLSFRAVPFLRTGLVSRDLHFAMTASHSRLKSWDGCLRFSRWAHLSEQIQLIRSEARLSDVQNLLHLPSTLPSHDPDDLHFPVLRFGH